jgi:hypothetical protein
MPSKDYNWRAPKPFNWRRVTVPATIVVLITVTAVVTAFLTRPDPPATPTSQAAPTARVLTPLETTAINTLIGLQRTGAHRSAGTITVNGHKFGVQTASTDDDAAGSGTITAGHARGDALLDHGVVYIRGDDEFFAALGISGPIPPPPNWVVAGDILQGKLFYSPATWTAALLPTPAATIDGSTYTVGANSATIHNGKDISHYNVNGVSVDITTGTVTEITATAVQLGAGHGPGAVPTRTAAGSWQLPAGPPPPPPPPAP